MEIEPKIEERKEKKVSPLEISEEIREELSALFRGEAFNGEKLPPVFLKISSGKHGTKEDADGIKPLLDEADVYVPEVFGWGKKDLSDFKKISQGEEVEPSEYEFVKKTEEYLSGTKKAIMIIDVPMSEIRLLPEKYNPREDVLWSLKETDYENAIDQSFEYIQSEAEIDTIHRESHMVEHFAEKLKKVIKDNPELQKKDSIKVLIVLGDAHSSIYYILKQIGGDNVTRDFRENPSHNFTSETMRRIGFKKEIDDELKERVLCETIFRSSELPYFLEEFCHDSSKKEFFLRYLVSLFSREEMKSLFEQWKNTYGYSTDIILSFLKQKDITFPKTEEGLDTLLSQTPYGKYKKILKEKEEQKNEHS